MPDEETISPEPEAVATQTAESPHAETQALEAATFETPAAEAEVAPTETQMIDVHAPHGGVHTWKDFWIHLGTITLGLLIAISLEQSVEALHHLHQRHQLEQDLHQEGLNNRHHAEVDVALNAKIVAWLLQLQHGVDEARATGGKAPFSYPARPDGMPDSPRNAAYQVLETEALTTARESSLLVLLPREEAQIYAHISYEFDQVQATRDHARELEARQGAFEARFSRGTYPAVFDLSRLTPQELAEYGVVLGDELEAVRMANLRLKLFSLANDYVLSGGVDEEGLRQAVQKVDNSH